MRTKIFKILMELTRKARKDPSCCSDDWNIENAIDEILSLKGIHVGRKTLRQIEKRNYLKLNLK